MVRMEVLSTPSCSFIIIFFRVAKILSEKRRNPYAFIESPTDKKKALNYSKRFSKKTQIPKEQAKPMPTMPPPIIAMSNCGAELSCSCLALRS